MGTFGNCLRLIVGVSGMALCVVVSVPQCLAWYQNSKDYKNIKAEVNSVNADLADLDARLDDFLVKYKKVAYEDNLSLAKLLASQKGATLRSIASLAEHDGGLIECSVVSDVEDVIFFSEEAVKMKFVFDCKDATRLLNSLRDTAVPVDSIVMDCSDGSVEVTVSTIFRTSKKDVAPDTSGGDGKDIGEELHDK